MTCKDQIHLKLTCLPGVLLIGVYIPPSDSPYFDLDSFAKIQSAIQGQERVIILVNMKTHFGQKASSFHVNKDPHLSYTSSPDEIPNPNANAWYALPAFEPLLLLNNLKTPQCSLPGGLTFH